MIHIFNILIPYILDLYRYLFRTLCDFWFVYFLNYILHFFLKRTTCISRFLFLHFLWDRNCWTVFKLTLFSGSGDDFLLIEMLVNRFEPNLFFIALLFIKVLLSVRTHLSYISSAYKWCYFNPIWSIHVNSCINLMLPSRNRLCSSLSHLPPLNCSELSCEGVRLWIEDGRRLC